MEGRNFWLDAFHASGCQFTASPYVSSRPHKSRSSNAEATGTMLRELSSVSWLLHLRLQSWRLLASGAKAQEPCCKIGAKLCNTLRLGLGIACLACCGFWLWCTREAGSSRRTTAGPRLGSQHKGKAWQSSELIECMNPSAACVPSNQLPLLPLAASGAAVGRPAAESGPTSLSVAALRIARR